MLTQPVKTALARGQFNHVPVVIGTNHDEYRLFVAGIQLLGGRVTAANYQTMIASTLGVSAAIAGAIAAQYPLSRYPSPPVALGAVGTDAIFACHALTAEQLLARYVPTFAYEFNDENAPGALPAPGRFPLRRGPRVRAAVPVQPDRRPAPRPFSPAQQQLAAAMKQDWTNLAKTGIPAAGWPRFAGTSQRMQSLVPPAPAGRDGLRRPAPLRVLGARTLAQRVLRRPPTQTVMLAGTLVQACVVRRPCGAEVSRLIRAMRLIRCTDRPPN